jgi:helicase
LNKIKLLSNRLILSSFPSTNSQLETCNLPLPSTNSQLASTLSSPPPCNSNDQRLTPIVEIDQRRPDRIIFEGKEVKVTATEFSLIHFLAQHNEQVMSYDELANGLWGDEKVAIYTRVSYHFSKIRSTIFKTIGKSKRNKEKVKNIFKVVPRRGIMLNLEENKLKIN